MPAVYGVFYADPAHKHLIPTDSDQKLLEELVTVLAFEEITRTSSSEKVPTVGIILPTVQVFFQLLEPNDTDLSAIKKVKQAIKADLSSRYQKEDTQMFLSVCSFLDPRFKSLPWPTEEKRQEVHAKVKEEMHRISAIPVKIKSEVVETPDPDPEKNTYEPEAKKAKLASEGESFFDVIFVCQEKHAELSPAEKVDREFDRYIKQMGLHHNEKDILTWWQVNRFYI